MGMKYMFAMECSNPWVIAGPAFMVILQVLFTYIRQMNQMFHSAPIGLSAWGKILFISLTIYSIVGKEKRFRRRFEAKRPRTTPFGKCELPNYQK
jgi:magnesium-transporting ATPase (P-type)